MGLCSLDASSLKDLKQLGDFFCTKDHYSSDDLIGTGVVQVPLCSDLSSFKLMQLCLLKPYGL